MTTQTDTNHGCGGASRTPIADGLFHFWTKGDEGLFGVQKFDVLLVAMLSFARWPLGLGRLG